MQFDTLSSKILHVTNFSQPNTTQNSRQRSRLKHTLRLFSFNGATERLAAYAVDEEGG